MGEDDIDRLRLALEAGGMGTWTWDISTGAVSWSPEVAQLFGRDLAEFAGTLEAAVAAVHPDDRPLLEAAAERALRTGEDFRLEHRTAPGPDGVRWVKCLGRISKDARGAPAKMFGIVFDVTDAKILELKLRTSNERFEALARATRDVFYEWDHRTGSLVFNEGSVSSLGHAPLQDIAFWESQLHPEDRARAVADLQRAVLSDAEGWTFEYRFRRADGMYCWILDRGLFLRNADGRVERMIGVMVDVTELRDAQNRLALSDRMASLGTLAAGVAHEINNPLAWVLSNLGALREGVDRLSHTEGLRSEVTTELLKLSGIIGETFEGADRVRRIVRDLRTFSRPEEDHSTQIDLVQVLESTLALAGNVIRHHARLEREYRSQPTIQGNPARLGQVFLNLLMNAAQAMAERRLESNVLRVTVDTWDDRAVVSVADSGPGIPEAIRPYMFEPFFTTKPVGVGTGLGLSIVKRIVDAHRGEIEVHSRSGHGTVIRVLLPLASSSHRVAPETRLPLAAPEGGLHIGVLDDEPLVGRALQRALGEHEVTVMTSPNELLERIARGETWDALLCDLMMPQMSASELHARLRRDAPILISRMIYMTGGALNGGAAEFLRQLPNPKLEKPFEIAEVHAALAKVTRTR